jgi:hypothetical protein
MDSKRSHSKILHAGFHDKKQQENRWTHVWVPLFIGEKTETIYWKLEHPMRQYRGKPGKAKTMVTYNILYRIEA